MDDEILGEITVDTAAELEDFGKLVSLKSLWPGGMFGDLRGKTNAR